MIAFSRLVRLAATSAFATWVATAPAFAERPEAPSVNITLGATSSSSSFFAFHAAVSKALSVESGEGIRARVMETGASVDNLNLMRQGRIQLGHSTSFALSQSYFGKGPWEEKGADKDVRAVMSFNLSPQILAVRADAGIASPKDLEGKSFSSGIQGSSSAIEVQTALDAIGVTPEYQSSSLEDALTKVQDGRIVGLAKSSPAPETPDASLLRLQASVDTRILSFTDEQLAEIQEKAPLLVTFVVPPNTYENQDKPANVIGHTSGFAAPASTDPDIIYYLWEAMTNQRDILGEVNPHWTEVDFVKLTLEGAPPVPLHLGAYRWLKDHGADIPDKLVPPEAKR
ncbi:MAG: TAXI family TRAP transporter solute-binding subunit [Rhodospirillum sp.]|nr:TAXI family TRAP transporter solute-binding subunit [Rhodospirillum sp.]MCF8489700.1 TAXI family TRAP transporter solute-binding subunit [Rhodospirillum sp.]MCF8501675.1 TAXI family TRAP transporter solute-binding subunit [Rhodospirillum sp.]